MLSQNIFYEPNYLQYNIGIYNRYNNLAIPNKYPPKPVKRCNYCFSSEEDNYNSKGFYILTDKNNSTINQNYLNRLVTEDIYSFPNSQNNYKDFNYQPISVKKTDSNNNIILKENNPKIANCPYIPIRKRDKVRNSNEDVNKCYNILNNNNEIKNDQKNNNQILKKKYSSIAIGLYNQKFNQDNSAYYNSKNNNTIRQNNQPLTKHNSHSLLIKDYQRNTNTLNNEFNEQNNFTGKPQIHFDLDKEIELDSKTFNNGSYTINAQQSQTFANNFKINIDRIKKFDDYKNNTDRQKKNDDLSKNIKINNIYKNNNSKLTKIIKNNININNNGFNKEENKAYKPNLKKNISYSQIETNIEHDNNFLTKYLPNEKKRKNTLIINTVNNTNIDNQKKQIIFSSNKMGGKKTIKKISLINIPNLNDNLENNKNHSYFETKSLSKDYTSQKNMKVKNNNNNFFLSLPNNRNFELKLKTNNGKLIKANTNNIMIGDNYKYKNEKPDLLMSKINSSEINICPKKEEISFILKQEASKSTFENSNKSEINNNIFKPIKENINTMNINPNIYTNYMNGNKIDNNKTVVIKVDKVKYNNYQGNIINKKITNTNEDNSNSNNYNEYIVDLKAKKKNNRGLGPIPYPSNYNSIKTNKIVNCNIFSYFPNTNANINKKKHFDNKNLIQLFNINYKSYEEDFPLNAKNNINYVNKILKSQIAVRLALFGTKKQENEQYYFVNKFYSQNIRDKPEESESDF